MRIGMKKGVLGGVAVLGLGLSVALLAQAQSGRRVTVGLKKTSDHLYFSGVIKPIHRQPIPSPVEGVVRSMVVRYGQSVKPHDLLLTLSSTELSSKYYDAFVVYLRAKDKVGQGKKEAERFRTLWKAGIISKNAYLKDQRSVEDSYLDWLKAKHLFEETANKVGHVNLAELERLSLSDRQAIEAMMRETVVVDVLAPVGGMVLLPDKAGGKPEDPALYVGAKVTEGQALFQLADLSGFSVEVNVNEVDINRMKPGLKAVVTGPAFPNHPLVGTVSQVNTSEALLGGRFSSSVVVFPVTITIKSVSPSTLAQVHSGMSAKVAIELSNQQALRVPLKAVIEHEGKPFVRRVDPATQAIQEVPVTLGKTTVRDVVVTQGIVAGDTIIVFH